MESNAAKPLMPRSRWHWAEAGLEGQKIVQTSAAAVGETITFQISATNTGNVTLNDVAVASDLLTRLDGTVVPLTSGPTFAGADQGSGAGVLVPGEVATYLATYTLTQPISMLAVCATQPR